MNSTRIAKAAGHQREGRTLTIYVTTLVIEIIAVTFGMSFLIATAQSVTISLVKDASTNNNILPPMYLSCCITA